MRQKTGRRRKHGRSQNPDSQKPQKDLAALTATAAVPGPLILAALASSEDATRQDWTFGIIMTTAGALICSAGILRATLRGRWESRKTQRE